MTAIQATAEVFFQALQTLTKKEQLAFFEKLLHDRRYREDLIDLALIEARQNEPSRSLRLYLAERRRAHR